MRLLDRYIARQILISATYAVGVIIIILVLGNVFQEILKELAKRPDISLLFVLKFILLVIPISLSLAVPFSFLTAILLTFGRLSADSEFISMRMAGLSMSRICLPVGVVALFFTVICAIVNLSVTPWAKTEMEGMKATLFNLVKKEPLLLFPSEGVMTDLPGYLLYARKEEGILKGLQLIRMENNVPQAIAIAREARVAVDLEAKTPELVLEMDDVNLMVRGENGDFMRSSQPVFMKAATTGVSMDMLKDKGGKAREKPVNVPLRTLFDKSADQSLEPNVRAAYQTELSMRFAFSFSCITFGLIGVPLGITSQRRESGSGFILSMMIAVTNYVMLTMAQSVKDKEEMYPHLLVWIPNLVFITLGLILFRRLSKK